MGRHPYARTSMSGMGMDDRMGWDGIGGNGSE